MFNSVFTVIKKGKEFVNTVESGMRCPIFMETLEKGALMKCPVDGELLVMTERSGVEIDYCPRCRGVWLDRGELDKIVDAAAGAMALPDPTPPPASQPAPQQTPQPRVYQEPYREERREPEREYEKGKRYKKKKRKGGFADILEDLFDFD